ncbi:LysR family transcriptional regulator [Mesorhizobium sp. M3A.F.Ca.ET.080.04.2.1]|uniref:LysR substrate-binding domain-containing protein n=1 Tax=Mesorhizobium sp. M3A.F.Ca.ET.080.04.2.1 TaxID=2493676 RepID=UPI000F7567C5|nr:LysR substrate-binding domain-containing protein [Mesorhizobium sp. M3A.F.Ca.ET.080.04.2.1]AZO07898.1 LysR family transcriptional regulator [Mesorhizobium sp. M3A.F.Ca.ET.080.04.2.1]RWF22052.1 MAG: LysR family transcriptional regulator [Mesorhizobium sp.]
MKYWRHVPPLRVMLAIEATARLESVSKAAIELNVTQSAVSHLLTQAEDFLAVRLFDRQSRPVRTTAEGKRYVSALVAGLDIIRLEGEALQRGRNADSLTVSCNLAYANFWLLPRLKEFHEIHPQITVNMVTAYQGLPELSERIDLSVRFGKGNWADCDAELLLSELITPVASPAYLARSPTVETPRELTKHLLLHARADDKTWFDWEQWFDHYGIKTNSLPGPHFDNHLTMMQAALAGEGIALGWIGTATEFVRAGQLVELFDDKIQADGGIYLVWRRNIPLSTAAKTFAKWLLAMRDDGASS